MTRSQIIAALKPLMAVDTDTVSHALRAGKYQRGPDGWRLARGARSKAVNR
jgi:hypothetical protein